MNFGKKIKITIGARKRINNVKKIEIKTVTIFKFLLGFPVES